MIITMMQQAKTEDKHPEDDSGRWGLESKDQGTALENRLLLHA